MSTENISLHSHSPSDRPTGVLQIRGSDSDSEPLKSRVKSAEDEQLAVKVVARGLYRVTSESGAQRVVNLTAVSDDGEQIGVCPCEDFRFRCLKEQIDCKHLISVKQRIQNGELPPPDADPEKWFESRREDAVKAVERRIEQTHSSVLQDEYQGVKTRIQSIENVDTESLEQIKTWVADIMLSPPTQS